MCVELRRWPLPKLSLASCSSEHSRSLNSVPIDRREKQNPSLVRPPLRLAGGDKELARAGLHLSGLVGWLPSKPRDIPLSCEAMLLLVDMGRHASDNEATTRGAASRSATPPPVAHAASGGCVMVSAEPELERLIHSFTPAALPNGVGMHSTPR